MKHRIAAILPAFLALAITPVAFTADNKNEADEVAVAKGNLNKKERVEEFRYQALGMFIHWSVDSQLGSVISHNLVGASDDYANRYFAELPKSFNPRKFNPVEWAELAKLCGFKYAVLTTKHHNGFCLWPTKTTDFSVASTPYGKDIVKAYAEAFRGAGLGMGFYHSPDDFRVLHKQGKHIARNVPEVMPSNNPELMKHNLAQIGELYSNYGKVDYLFLDGEATGLRDLAWKLQPDTLVTRGAMETPEQRLPKKALKEPWEACFTLGTQWQFKPTNEKYKSGTELINMLIETRAKGGNLLLNIGPEPSGVIPFEQERIIRELGLWLFVNQEAIYRVRPWNITNEKNIWFVKSADEPGTVYAFLTDLKPTSWDHGQRREFVVKSIRTTDKTKMSVLGHDGATVEYFPKIDATPRFTQKEDGLHLSIVRGQRIYNQSSGPSSWPNPVVVKLTAVEYAGDAKK